MARPLDPIEPRDRYRSVGRYLYHRRPAEAPRVDRPWPASDAGLAGSNDILREATA